MQKYMNEGRLYSLQEYKDLYRGWYCPKLQGKRGPKEHEDTLNFIDESIYRYVMDVTGGDPTGDAYLRAEALKAIKEECSAKNGGKRRHSKKRRTQKRGKTRIHAALNTFVRKGNRLDRDVSTRF